MSGKRREVSVTFRPKAGKDPTVGSLEALFELGDFFAKGRQELDAILEVLHDGYTVEELRSKVRETIDEGVTVRVLMTALVLLDALDVPEGPVVRLAEVDP